MKTQGTKAKTFRRNRAFTLVELLVVIGIIAILAGLSIPVGNQVLVKARILKARAQMNAIEAAVRNYNQEYSRWPIEPGQQGGPDLFFEVSDVGGAAGFMSALLGDNPASGVPNPRLTGFIEPDYSPGGRGGIDPTDTIDLQWNDPWGNPYIVVVDANYDKRLADPTDPAVTLRKSVLIVSGGPNHEGIAISASPASIAGLDLTQPNIIYSWK